MRSILSPNNNPFSNAINCAKGYSSFGSLGPKAAKAKPKGLVQAVFNNSTPSSKSLGVALGDPKLRRYIIVGERRLSNYWWTLVIFLGACGFLYTGFSAYMFPPPADVLSPITNSASNSNAFAAPPIIDFFPQGLLMSFYGSLGLLLSFYWILLILWNVGGGFNEFNKKEGFIRIFRWGYPGKNRKIDFIYSLKDVEAIRVEIKQGFDPQRTIYLRLKGGPSSPIISPPDQKLTGNIRGLTGPEGANPKKGLDTPQNLSLKREIPLTGISQPLTLKEIEKQASELANFLQVSLEGL